MARRDSAAITRSTASLGLSQTVPHGRDVDVESLVADIDCAPRPTRFRSRVAMGTDHSGLARPRCGIRLLHLGISVASPAEFRSELGRYCRKSHRIRTVELEIETTNPSRRFFESRLRVCA